MSKKEEYLKKMEVDGTIYIGEFSNEHGEVFCVHFPLKQNDMMIRLNMNGPEGIFFQIAGDETDWQTYSVVGQEMVIARDVFQISAEEKLKLRRLIMSREKDVMETAVKMILSSLEVKK